MSEFFAGLDLGQARDYTALAVAERVLPPRERQATYLFRHVQRLPLGTAYPTVVSHVTGLLNRAPLKQQTTLSLDYTGVGRPVADMFRQAHLPCALYLISLHGGTTVTWGGLGAITVSVPKRDLVSSAQVLLQSRRLEIAGTMPDTANLVSELRGYQVKIDPQTAHDSYAAWREGVHDDLVFAVALACWMGENKRRAYAV
jgi:hypothetical protein